MEYLFCSFTRSYFLYFSYLNVFLNYKEIDNAKKIYDKILDNEKQNGMPKDIIIKEKFLLMID